MEGIKLTEHLNCKISKNEDQVLISFAEFGCVSIHKNDYYKTLVLVYKDEEYIKILLKDKTIKLSEFKLINIEEFKLLNELFKIWRWL